MQCLVILSFKDFTSSRPVPSLVGDVALSVGPALMVVYVIMGAVGPGGASADLPRLLKPVQWASPVRWACEALCAAELRGKSLTYRKAKSSSSLAVTREAGARLLSLSSIGNILRGTIRFIGSHLLDIGDILTKIGIKAPEVAAVARTGDRTLAILNIPDADVSKSSSVLAKMLGVHILVAWAGLIWNGSRR